MAPVITYKSGTSKNIFTRVYSDYLFHYSYEKTVDKLHNNDLNERKIVRLFSMPNKELHIDWKDGMVWLIDLALRKPF